jgi:hypothetical protein
MDEELRDLAALALRNAFWLDFSALVNVYLEAAEGLDISAQLMTMGELTSVYGRDTDAKADEGLNIWTLNQGTGYRNTGHDTILEALEHKGAIEVHLRGRKVFEKRDGEWQFVDHTPAGP